MDTPTNTYLPLPDAAALLGISQSALRRRLRAGSAHGERRPTSSGFMWWVSVVDGPLGSPIGETPTAERGTPTATQAPTPQRPPLTPTPDTPAATRAEEAPGAVQETEGATEAGLLARRASEMATYTRELLAPLHARLEAQATQIGRLENEVEHLRAQLAARAATSTTSGVAHDDQAAEIVTTTAAPETRSAPPVGQKGRPRRPSWWRRLFGD